MEILKELKEKRRTRTVLRITCVKDFNMHKIEEFVQHVKKMQPDVIECKGFMHMGYAMYRLQKANAPRHEEIKEFARKLAELTGYKLYDEIVKSTICMLVNYDYEEKYGTDKIKVPVHDY